MQHHIFLSYSRKDTPVMHRVEKDLRRTGLTVWTDEGIEPGTTSWQRAIEQAIIHCGCLLCIMSPHSAQSEWVREELNFARIHEKQVILLMARGDESTSIPFGFSRSQYVDIRTQQLYKDNMLRLIKGLHKRFVNVKLSPTRPLPPLPQNFGLSHKAAPPISVPDVSNILPEPFNWCQIPAGEVKVESHIHSIEPFYIAKYPITNAQYDVFIKAPDGYTNTSWWDFSDPAAAWRAQNSSSSFVRYSGDKLPRTVVNWYEAIAFTRWLRAALNTPFIITLPTEAQWQWAAQSDDSRSYPWGNDYRKERCNTLKSNQLQPTPVDAYPGGASPFDVLDMCGNVSEWCLSEWDGHAADLSRSTNRVVRGGDWESSRTSAQITMRNYAAPEIQSISIGFRICLFEPA